ncbi:hypothetical protein JB92DRAFT_3121029 [Gautieria morchelliformis]|nr:hypothetical protein JB92DRAFT_3121029 [Gautieria morchelliformis]
MLFDTLIVVVTLYNTLGLVRLSREFQMLPRKSLTQILAEQGLIRYGFILTITLASGITTKVLRPIISTILSSVQNSLSVIIIYRCHLALQERAARPNGNTHSAHHPVMSFRVASRQIHDLLMEEFGDLSVSETGIAESHKQDDPSSTEMVGFELEEIPCRRELGSAVDNSSSEVCAEPQSEWKSEIGVELARRTELVEVLPEAESFPKAEAEMESEPEAESEMESELGVVSELETENRVSPDSHGG